MKLRDLVEEIVIDPRKLTGYVLNEQNERGKHKARLFKSILGFTITNYELLLEEIRTKAPQNEALFRQKSQHGLHYQVDIMVTGPNSHTARVRTGWIIEFNSQIARLTSAYILKK